MTRTSWSEIETRTLRDHYPTMGAEGMRDAGLSERTARAITNKARKMGVYVVDVRGVHLRGRQVAIERGTVFDISKVKTPKRNRAKRVPVVRDIVTAPALLGVRSIFEMGGRMV